MYNPYSTRRSEALPVIVLVLLLLAGEWAYHRATTNDTHAYTVPVPDYTGSLSRLEYQDKLNASPDRFEPQFDVVRLGTEAWLRMDADTGYCKYRCGTLRRTPNGTEVTLPVGYIHDRDVSPFPQTRTSITRLTYWDEESHRPRTIVRRPGQVSVELPDSILEHQGVNGLQHEKTAYVEAWQIRQTTDGRIFLNPEAAIRNEPLGRQFMRGEDALIVKRGDGKGIVVVLPKGYRPVEGNVGYWIPIEVHYATGSPVVPPVRSTMQV